ncbi:MAG TPA: hypothetical protein PLR99_30135, partial [Polyangiaceae bacterium]|nr:hypothetical protein [Polyangiaceae bacterium]
DYFIRTAFPPREQAEQVIALLEDGGGPVKITVSPRPGAATTAGPHRRHDHPQAVAWRIVAGEERVARTEEAGKRFDVMLHPGESFDGVEVEYQDADGDWHAH